MEKKLIVIAVLLFSISAIGFSDTIHVPADKPNIQAGIDVAVNGDTVLVAPGTYEENIDFTGKNILLLSAQGAVNTVIDGGQAGSVVTFMSNEGPDAILDGFMITNGSGNLVEKSAAPGIERGGGIYCVDASPAIRSCHIIKNNAYQGAGAFFQNSGAHVTDCTVKNNRYGTVPNLHGTGIMSWKCSGLILEGNSIINNGGHDGGGIDAWDCSSLTIRNNTISRNYAEYGSGGIYLSGCTTTEVSGNFISENTGDGPSWVTGGIYCYYCEMTVIAHNQIVDNLGSGIVCSAIYTPNSVMIVDNFVSNCWGSGISCRHSSPDIMRNTVVDNMGYGIANIWSGEPLIAFNEVCYNQGGICASGDPLKVESNLILGNGHGYDMPRGGVYCSGSEYMVLRNNIIAFNYRDEGGGVYINGTDLTAVNNTLCGNTALEGGGLYCSRCEPEFVNSIFWGNEANVGPQIRLFSDWSNFTFTIHHCNVEGGQAGLHVGPYTSLNWGAGMIDSDPLFVDPMGDDFHLVYTSPCRDAGDNSAAVAAEDCEGDPRIAFDAVDMGADEFYKHLYCTGDFVPRGSVEAKFAGEPGTWPVGLMIGSGMVHPPHQHAWGEFYLEAPWLLVPLVPIPTDGVLIVPEMLPALPAAPYDIPMQAMIGWELSNPFNLEVRSE